MRGVSCSCFSKSTPSYIGTSLLYSFMQRGTAEILTKTLEVSV